MHNNTHNMKQGQITMHKKLDLILSTKYVQLKALLYQGWVGASGMEVILCSAGFRVCMPERMKERYENQVNAHVKIKRMSTPPLPPVRHGWTLQRVEIRATEKTPKFLRPKSSSSGIRRAQSIEQSIRYCGYSRG